MIEVKHLHSCQHKWFFLSLETRLDDKFNTGIHCIWCSCLENFVSMKMRTNHPYVQCSLGMGPSILKKYMCYSNARSDGMSGVIMCFWWGDSITKRVVKIWFKSDIDQRKSMRCWNICVEHINLYIHGSETSISSFDEDDVALLET